MLEKDALVSVIMSVYNETLDELQLSIDSILKQTYKRLEVIIVNDNPDNAELGKMVEQICKGDKRVKLVTNETNCGLVSSLNHALEYVTGDYIARMDADDISFPVRIEEQKKYLESNQLDLIGAYIQTIDEEGCIIKPEIKFPITHRKIEHYMQWGNFVPHPTWFGKREVFEKLHGYRQAKHCEDYYFLLRAFSLNFEIGNYPGVLLQYRIRKNGISVSNAAGQYILRRYLAKNKNNIIEIEENTILNYLNSEKYASETKKYASYYEMREALKNKKKQSNIFRLLISKFFYIDVKEKIMRKMGAQ